MDGQTKEIVRLTKSFYDENASSFSSTRDHPWEGWKRILQTVNDSDEALTVLDVACGNLRFERALAEARIHPVHTFAVDSCELLLEESTPQPLNTERICADVIELIASGRGFDALHIPPCTLTVCFGFMHHVPTCDLRRTLLEQLLASTCSGGQCALSFWRYRTDERLRKKADLTTRAACARFGLALPDEHDGFLGWQESSDAFRFCHSFTDEEIDALTAHSEALGAQLIDDFSADGKSGTLNRYLVLRCS